MQIPLLPPSSSATPAFETAETSPSLSTPEDVSRQIDLNSASTPPSPFSPQTSPDGNVTLSVINYVPSVRDAGKYMSCRAGNPELPDASTLEDGWKLEIHCECSAATHLFMGKGWDLQVKRPNELSLRAGARTKCANQQPLS